MNKVKVFCGWELDIDLFHDKQIELYVDKFPTDIIPENVVRFVLLIEPEEILNLTHQAMYFMKHRTYNFLLTHNDFLVENCPNAHLFEFGTTWIRDYVFPEKKFEISTLVGGKLMAYGHGLRQELWQRQGEVIIPNKFFLSGAFGGIDNPRNNPVLGQSKEPLFESQFHFCIENINRKNWFTEKLMDCFQTKTVPIYWGCPNISDWFDVNGMIIVNSVDEMISKSNELTSESYQQMIPFIEKNLELSNKFCKIDKRIKDKIIDLI
jgi:hypothetical protein